MLSINDCSQAENTLVAIILQQKCHAVSRERIMETNGEKNPSVMKQSVSEESLVPHTANVDQPP